jgi:aminoglycoside phosphotransferase (APT) family kinase protein
VEEPPGRHGLTSSYRSRVPQWQAERSVDAARAAALIGSRFPALRELPVTPLGEGWDNTVFAVGDAWVFRFPRRAIALPGFCRELAVLPAVAARLPLPVPAPVWIATDDDPAEPWPFAGARLLPGTELADAALPDADRAPAAAVLGRFLRVLHDPAGAAVGAPLPVDPLDRAFPVARAEGTDAALTHLVTDGLWDGDPAVGRLLAEARRLGRPAGKPVLVHGDLHVRHLLVDGAGAPTGVIDWGDVCLADPAVDLAVAFAAFGGAARGVFVDDYGAVGGERELRARALAVRLSALLAGYAAADGRPALLAEALAGLRRAVA